ncbi:MULTISPECIES: hypothetical protein [unclassified Rhizobium]|uniref:hypothetical protein n=1 Tax=unclassified Rhizobium TaxID=2613769 RepID=UPI003802E065
MGKLTLAFLAVVLAIFAAQAVFPTTTANAVPAIWVARVVSEREIAPEPPRGGISRQVIGPRDTPSVKP